MKKPRSERGFFIEIKIDLANGPVQRALYPRPSTQATMARL
jgi:hypothetical protein